MKGWPMAEHGCCREPSGVSGIGSKEGGHPRPTGAGGAGIPETAAWAQPHPEAITEDALTDGRAERMCNEGRGFGEGMGWDWARRNSMGVLKGGWGKTGLGNDEAQQAIDRLLVKAKNKEEDSVA